MLRINPIFDLLFIIKKFLDFLFVGSLLLPSLY